MKTADFLKKLNIPNAEVRIQPSFSQNIILKLEKKYQLNSDDIEDSFYNGLYPNLVESDDLLKWLEALEDFNFFKGDWENLNSQSDIEYLLNNSKEDMLAHSISSLFLI